jgi:hypothetical protein
VTVVTVTVTVTVIVTVTVNSDRVCGSDSGRVCDNWSTLIFQGGRMGQGKGVVASFWLELENQGVGASFRLEPEN